MSTRTKKLYHADPTLLRATARVLAVENDAVIVDQTIFFPEGGGQEGDHGLLGPLRVRDTQKRGGEMVIRQDLPVIAVNTEVVHHIDGDTSLVVPGQEVDLVVDAVRREGCTRLHSATHLALARLQELFPEESFLTAGCRIGPIEARLDVHTDRKFVGALLDDIQAGVDAWIASDAEVERWQVPEVSEMFLWHVELSPYLHMPCGGTHVARLGEIGPVRLKRRGLGKGRERLYILPVVATEVEGV